VEGDIIDWASLGGEELLVASAAAWEEAAAFSPSTVGRGGERWCG
jgi:hypothetical protein